MRTVSVGVIFLTFVTILSAFRIQSKFWTLKKKRKNVIPVSSSSSPLIREETFRDLSANFLQTVNDTVHQIHTSSTSSSSSPCVLKFKPGFSFSMDCNFWKSNLLCGGVRNWIANPFIHWISESIVYPDENLSFIDDYLPPPIQKKEELELKVEDLQKQNLLVDNNNNSGDDNDTSHANLFKLDFIVLATLQSDIPHLYLSISYDRSSSFFTLQLDYLPRQDLIANISYYDKYYKDLNYTTITELLGFQSYRFDRRNVAANLIHSPYLINCIVSREGKDGVFSACKEHVNRWCEWLLQSSKEAPSVAKSDASRDMRIWFETLKLSYADTLGGAFAPKALEVAATIIGPVIE